MLDIVSPDLAPALAPPMAQIENAFLRLSNLVKESPQAVLDYRGPAGSVNSIAMLITHLAVVDNDYLHEIMGVPCTEEEDAFYGPYHDENGRIPLVTGRSAEELLAHYRGVIDNLRNYLLTKSDEEATRPVKVAWWPEQATVRYILWHLAAHSMLHQGQISRLKEAYKEAP